MEYKEKEYEQTEIKLCIQSKEIITPFSLHKKLIIVSDKELESELEKLLIRSY